LYFGKDRTVARLSSKEILGFLPISPEHHEAILSLVVPATPAHRLLDPFAGEGEFLEVAVVPLGKVG
jgi:hypothetical protein